MLCKLNDNVYISDAPVALYTKLTKKITTFYWATNHTMKNESHTFVATISEFEPFYCIAYGEHTAHTHTHTLLIK